MLENIGSVGSTRCQTLNQEVIWGKWECSDRVHTTVPLLETRPGIRQAGTLNINSLIVTQMGVLNTRGPLPAIEVMKGMLPYPC